MDSLQIGKQIGKLLDMPKGPQAQKHIILTKMPTTLKRDHVWCKNKFLYMEESQVVVRKSRFEIERRSVRYWEARVYKLGKPRDEGNDSSVLCHMWCDMTQPVFANVVLK